MPRYFIKILLKGEKVMASQPTNADISVARRVRSYRQDLRHNTILDMAQGHMRELVMSVPGEEDLVTETRAGVELVTTAVGGRLGLPVVRELRPVTTLEEAVESMSNMDFPVRMPGHRDVFLNKSSANLEDDLHQDLRDVK